jgi:alkyldihydroxyacetonephosphate synthase
MDEQCMAIKTAAYDAVMKAGGTITHHHAVGRLHMPWYLEQRPKLIGAAFAAAKRALDPAGIMNPGVITLERDIAAWRRAPAAREAVAAS